MSKTITHEMESFASWKNQVSDSLHELSKISSQLELLPSSSILRIDNQAEIIKKDTLQIAIVGEFSRGKSELINALFFSDMGKRFLPTSSGQTTMCPVEIRSGKPALHLLPISSRSMDASIEKLRKVASSWVRISYEEENNRLGLLTENICVTIEEARKLGLCPPLKKVTKNQEKTVCPSCGLGKVLIPRWRHAILFVQHPILDSGITVLDTPGLNAIGAEPELTFEILAKADAVFFVLSVDSGVTQSDLIIWEQYLKSNENQKQIVLLNKIDTLWDELKDPFEIEEEIEEQIEKTAKRLGIERNQVIAVSGQKALLAKIRGNDDLLEKSGILDLEKAIEKILIPERKKQLSKEIYKLEKQVVNDQSMLLHKKESQIKDQIKELFDVKEKHQEKIPQLIKMYKERISQIEEDKSKFEIFKTELEKLVDKLLLEPLSTDDFDLIISEAKGEMLSAWTTSRIVDRFRGFFSEALRRFDESLAGAEFLNQKISEKYKTFQTQYELPSAETIPYAILPRRSELQSMAQNYERFGATVEIAVNTQGAVVRKVFLTAANKIRDFMVETQREAKKWSEEVMDVLNRYLDDYQKRSKEELKSLEKMAIEINVVDERIDFLNSEKEKLKQDTKKLEETYKKLENLLN
ncbi:MAG: dynamin family protein [Acidithiobacillus sp.]|nr:dynamin family protein [Acidithiobacillus sp.]